MVISSLVRDVDEAGGTMRVQRVLLPGTRVESWTVLDDDGVPVEPVERWLAFLSDVDLSPNTVKAYAHDVKDFLVFLAVRGLDWREVRLEDVGEFVAWLALPPELRGGQLGVLAPLQPHVGAATVSRKLSALAAFYSHQARHGVDVGELLRTWHKGGRRVWKSFLHHVTKGKPQATRTIKLRVPKKLPRVVTAAEMQAILDACEHLRDRLLFALLWDAGIRIGEALGLRHEDIAAAERQLTVVPRANANGARAKSGGRIVPVGAEVVRLYGDYLHTEYGDLDSDYVFVNLWAEPLGRPWTYAAVYDLVKRLRGRTGVDFDPHWARHAYATRALRDGVPIEVVSSLLGHASVTTTTAIYGHLTVEDARAALEAAGWFAGKQLSW
jgi:site-specific recombinase XerD